MKKLIYTVALVVMGITASYAQQAEGHKKSNETPEQRAEKSATALEARLSLTADQKQKVQALELERIKKGEEFRKGDAGDRKAKMEERKAFMKASKEKMEAILTADQKAKLAAYREQRENDRKEDMDANGGKKPKKGPKEEKASKPVN